MTYQFLSRIIPWSVFAIALITYCLTLEPTNSWWDCGEYISTAYKLQVGHPPGAPLFLLIANLFSQLAFGNVEKVALMVNFMSALCSASTVLFLFWTIKIVTLKIVNENSKNISLIAASIGSLSYAFSDSFWFSAVEGEVYAMSSLFTAVVFWAIIKWENEYSLNTKSDKWIIFIFYLIGLSIGVHMLSLLVIPSIVLIYYFKKYKFSTSGFIFANFCGVILLAVIYNLIIPQFVNLAGKLEIFFVNELSLPFNSGTIFFFLLIITSIVFGLIKTKKYNYYTANTAILACTFLLIGYMSFFTLIIRSNANTPIDENSPEDAVSLLSYLNREQYGSNPLLFGHFFNTEVVDYADGKAVYVKDENSGKYIISDDRKKSVPVYENATSGLFPRMWSKDDRHISAYKEWAKIKNVNKKPTAIQNIRYFINYQINHMYIRYFMWNFVGKQNDKQGHGELSNGNWISGINFLDNARLGPQDNIPNHLKNNAGRNNFYFLPLILGLLGFFHLYKKNPKDTWSIFLLFFFTGIAIVIELNQTPFQPRERDYAYVGSFYAFSIWIGLGSIFIYEIINKLTNNIRTSTIISCLLFTVPFMMAIEGWDDHDRSNRYTATEFAKNYLKSCEPNAILFTMGDNDTFPLWYVQEVEGYRTDVRIVNLSLLNTDWYIDQMKRDAYDGKAVPFSLSRNQYKQGTRDVAIFIDKGASEKRLELGQFNKWIKSDRKETKINIGKDYDFYYTKKIRIPVNKSNINDLESDLVADYIDIDLNTNQLEKKDIMILDLIEKNDWERPIYFAITIGSSGRSFLYLNDHFRLDGMVYKLMPYRYKNLNSDELGGIDTQILFPILMEEYKWGNLNQDIYLDETNLRMTMNFRNNFSRLANELINENEFEKAKEVLDYSMKIMPGDKIPLNYFIHPIIECYYKINSNETANELITELYKIYSSELQYYFSFPENKIQGVSMEILKNLQFYNQMIEICSENNHPDTNRFKQNFEDFYRQYLIL